MSLHNFYKNIIMTEKTSNVVTIPVKTLDYFRVELQSEKRLNVIWKDLSSETGLQPNGSPGVIRSTSCLFHAVWLRNSCRCPQCVSPCGQKTMNPVKTSDPNLKLMAVKVSDGVLHMSWSCGHNGYIEGDWLKQHRYVAHVAGEPDLTKPVSFATEMPKMSATELQDNEGLWRWLRYLNEYGVCLLTNLEPKVGKVVELARMIYNVQPTVYGETFAVVSEEVATNIAYSTVALDYHMDQLQYESPPGLQLFHCIRFDSCVKGGESVILDTFPVVEELRKQHPNHFETLKRVPATFQTVQYDRAEPIDMVYQRPHVVVDDQDRITAINWCPQTEGPLVDVLEEDILPYYDAYNTLAKMFEASNLKLVHRLKEGEVLSINNRRLIHSRNQFSLNGGVRHMEGVYVNIDEFKSKFKVLCSKVGQPNYPVKRVLNRHST